MKEFEEKMEVVEVKGEKETKKANGFKKIKDKIVKLYSKHPFLFGYLTCGILVEIALFGFGWWCQHKLDSTAEEILDREGLKLDPGYNAYGWMDYNTKDGKTALVLQVIKRLKNGHYRSDAIKGLTTEDLSKIIESYQK